ncbi:MAG: hypothetical protein NBKEAIPA_00535 [Nitrospirae bacterium]|nr:hypothetical protein [Nitrospirota bacterium]MCE7963998.1 hypothetical protein [Nitrospira sp. NTP2]MCK6492810.1 HEAT repeat domain-containing protein [Nitrospira sp.]MEB2337152.1 HEAT repeat domain-containing protein [Nitrospirales bacterium]QOJ34484.1 MAG: HEAT repeat domain-containing protein [Nitrospira sp.]
MTDRASSATVLTPREVGLHLGGLLLVMGLLALWYWLSTGARAVPSLIEMLGDDDPSTRVAAAEQLGHIGQAAQAAAPALSAQATRDVNQHANTTAAAALKSIDLTTARHVMTHFSSRLQDQDAQQRRTAAAVLGSLGPVAQPAVPALLTAAHDPDDLVRRNALAALGSIGIPAPLITAALVEGLHDASSIVRHGAVSQFAFMVPVPEEAASALTAVLTSGDPTLATLAGRAIERSKQDPSPARALAMMIQYRTAREYALHQLAQLGPAAHEALSAVLPLLEDDQPFIRYLAAQTIHAMGPAAQSATTVLQRHREDRDPVVQASIAEALAAIDPSPTSPGQAAQGLSR